MIWESNQFKKETWDKTIVDYKKNWWISDSQTAFDLNAQFSSSSDESVVSQGHLTKRTTSERKPYEFPNSYSMQTIFNKSSTQRRTSTTLSRAKKDPLLNSPTEPIEYSGKLILCVSMCVCLKVNWYYVWCIIGFLNVAKNLFKIFPLFFLVMLCYLLLDFYVFFCPLAVI